ncbi:MAG TPA: hypothetical protein VKY65_04240, partial [Alphaproteobacteria bacterium]|nr:hypothetical protein [Alphaproteobacteria bacterium]
PPPPRASLAGNGLPNPCANARGKEGKEVLSLGESLRAETLREQAAIMRGLAKTVEVPAIAQQLLLLAERCEALAADLEAAAGKPPG